MIRRMRTARSRRLAALLLAVAAGVFGSQVRPVAQQDGRAPQHARQYRRLLIRNAMVIYGNGKPAYGPMDIVLQDGVIADIRPGGGRSTDADAVIDATGKYVMPGIVNTHMHWHEERAPGIPQPV
jgi:adenine deaminase